MLSTRNRSRVRTSYVATIGYSIGLITELFRQVAAALMVILGAVLIFPPRQTRLALASGPIANWTDRHLGSERGSGYAGQFGVGILLGASSRSASGRGLLHRPHTSR